jgi:putative transposase
MPTLILWQHFVSNRMDLIFDRTADGRSIKSLTVVDDAIHEAVAIVPERPIGGQHLIRILDRLAATRVLPQAIRTDNGKDFCGRAMFTWAHERGVKLFLIEPGKPNQNAYIESFNGRFREECLNEHWATHCLTLLLSWASHYRHSRNDRVGGRPLSLSPTDLQAAKAMLKDTNITVATVARRLNVAASTLYRHIPPARSASLEDSAEI